MFELGRIESHQRCLENEKSVERAKKKTNVSLSSSSYHLAKFIVSTRSQHGSGVCLFVLIAKTHACLAVKMNFYEMKTIF